MAAARRLARVGRAGRPRERLTAAAEQRLAGLVPLREERFHAQRSLVPARGFFSPTSLPGAASPITVTTNPLSGGPVLALSETTPTPSTPGPARDGPHGRIEEQVYYWYSRINSSETAAGVSTPRSVKRSSMKSGGV